jgi:hypothetical protein
MAQMINVFHDVKARYQTDVLIRALTHYKEEHVKEYKLALDAYRLAIRKKIKELNKQFKNKFTNIQDFKLEWNLYAPVNVESAYDKLIVNFKNMNSDAVDLDMTQANCILNNDWDWAHAAKTSNSFYMMEAGSAR